MAGYNKNNFIIYNALFDSPKYYSEELAGGAAYWADDVQEVSDGKRGTY